MNQEVGCAARRGLLVVDRVDSETQDIDIVVAIGGDGTVLDAARTAYRLGVPVLGFNMGTIGFLAEAEPEDLEAALDRLATGDYRVEVQGR